jgi:hypothetical protein
LEWDIASGSRGGNLQAMSGNQNDRTLEGGWRYRVSKPNDLGLEAFSTSAMIIL